MKLTLSALLLTTALYSSLAISLVTSVARADGPLPVVAAKDQSVLLKSDDTKLAANKKLAYDFFRVILTGRHVEQTSQFMRSDYIQHNPNVDTGEAAFIQYVQSAGAPTDIPALVEDLVSIQAEGNFVTLSFVNAETGYTTTWFDMFRIQDGKIAEHWDCAQKN